MLNWIRGFFKVAEAKIVMEQRLMQRLQPQLIPVRSEALTKRKSVKPKPYYY